MQKVPLVKAVTLHATLSLKGYIDYHHPMTRGVGAIIEDLRFYKESLVKSGKEM